MFRRCPFIDEFRNLPTSLFTPADWEIWRNEVVYLSKHSKPSTIKSLDQQAFDFFKTANSSITSTSFEKRKQKHPTKTEPNTHLRAPLLVRVLVLDAVHLQAVRLQRAPLRERLLAQIALVRSDAGVRPGVPLQVERIVESLAAEGAQVALDIGVALHVPIQQPLQGKRLLAYPAGELVLLATGGATGLVLHTEHIRLLQQFGMMFVLVPQPAGDVLDGQWVLDAVATVDELQLHFCRQAELFARKGGGNALD